MSCHRTNPRLPGSEEGRVHSHVSVYKKRKGWRKTYACWCMCVHQDPHTCVHMLGALWGTCRNLVTWQLLGRRREFLFPVDLLYLLNFVLCTCIIYSKIQFSNFGFLKNRNKNKFSFNKSAFLKRALEPEVVKLIFSWVLEETGPWKEDCPLLVGQLWGDGAVRMVCSDRVGMCWGREKKGMDYEAAMLWEH